ncbi:extracellular solute-binding protein [Paenibacillus sp. GCM10023252]|uniref:extracellular solute-binding protein n=1 Tax=Paenibacillus sp. GCM10023252 TaxID=3252649 RepID=UPI00362436CC
MKRVNNKWFKLMTLVLTVALMGSLLAACSGGNGDGNKGNAGNNGGNTGAANEQTDSGAPDTSKKVELVWYLVGDAHKDQQQIVDEWNKMLEKDLNTTVKLNFTTWNDWTTKYNLLLTSGEKVDMIFASQWADFYRLANQGAFLDIKELLPKYAPKTWETVPKEHWADVTLDNKILAIPSTYAEYSPDGWVYREDWRQELGTPELTDLASIEAYLDAVKTKKQVTPINGIAYENVFKLFRAMNDYQPYINEFSPIASESYDNPREIINYAFTPEYEAWVKKMKEWQQKGYWSTNTLSSKQEAGDFVKTGQGAVYWRNPSAAGGFINEVKGKGLKMELGYFPFTRFHDYVVPTLSITNGMAVPKNAANPERSLMVLDKLRNDPRYFNLMTYGIEGRHWAQGKDDKTIVVPAPGIDLNEVPRYDIASWGWRYEPNMKTEDGAWSGLEALKQEFEGIAKPNTLSSISLNYDPVKSELAAVNQVVEQYGRPLMLGLVNDVDKKLQEYRDKLKSAGVDKLQEYVKTEVIKQLDAKGVK